jgi:hypothetical protein
VKAEHIRQEIRSIWPGVGFLWLPDGEYETPDIVGVIDVLKMSNIDNIEYECELWDCDDSALAANCWVKYYCYNEEGFESQWAFGECFASRLHGRDLAHTLCICRASDGIYLIEPKGYHYWRANGAEDTIHTVKM